MRVDWSPLRRAVRPGQRLWWRDDDAVAATPELDGLLRLSDEVRVPVCLAVIPALAKASLPQALGPDTRVMVHGWRHADTSQEGQKRSEFVSPRPAALRETAEALARMQSLFGSRLAPVFVPPWNRISDEIASGLAAQGYAALSTYGPRAKQRDVGVQRLNTHIDPIDWRGSRGLADPAALIDRAAAQMRDYPDEPLGFLTHHLVHTAEVTAFSRAFLLEMLNAGAVAPPVGSLIP
ncbi:MAG: polysaccharide deacetylase family protein [Pseudomonadota bacterium]